jgi:hypothetical protein
MHPPLLQAIITPGSLVDVSLENTCTTESHAAVLEHSPTMIDDVAGDTSRYHTSRDPCAALHPGMFVTEGVALAVDPLVVPNDVSVGADDGSSTAHAPPAASNTAITPAAEPTRLTPTPADNVR